MSKLEPSVVKVCFSDVNGIKTGSAETETKPERFKAETKTGRA